MSTYRQGSVIVNWISYFDEKGIDAALPVSVEGVQVREKLVAGLLDNLESDNGIDLDSVVIKGAKTIKN